MSIFDCRVSNAPLLCDTSPQCNEGHHLGQPDLTFALHVTGTMALTP